MTPKLYSVTNVSMNNERVIVTKTIRSNIDPRAALMNVIVCLQDIINDMT